MKDKWINSGYEETELKAHIEPVEDYSDASRIGESDGSILSPFSCSLHLDSGVYCTYIRHSGSSIIKMSYIHFDASAQD